MAGIDLSRAKAQAGRALAGFTSGQKAMLAIAAAATVAGALFFVQMSGSGPYAPLYTGLPPEDMAEVTGQLSSMGVAYKLSGDGATILVPRDEVYQTRLDLSAQGLPSEGQPGYALLDDASITTSEFRQRIDYQRALEGEIAKTIGAIEGVDAATVHLVIPESDLFADDDQHPSASVLVRLQGDRSLTGGQVEAIVHLTASSVEGLTPKHVTVADDTGRVLNAPGVDGAASVAGDARSEQTAAYEERVAQSLEELLAAVTGPGRARVQVAATLDFDRRSTTTESFDQPGTSPVLSEDTATETFAGSNPAVGGTLGVDGQPTPVDAGAANDGNYQRDSATRQYAVGKVTEQVETAPGAVEQLSVAVLVDAAVGAGTEEIEELVTTAAGIDPARGDAVSVQKLVFDQTAADAAKAELDAAAGSQGFDSMLGLARTAAAVVIVALVVFFAWRSAKRGSVARYPMALPLEAGEVRELAAANAALVAAGGTGSTAMSSLDEQGALPSAQDRAREQARDQTQSELAEMIDRQPDDVATVLRGWMTEHR